MISKKSAENLSIHSAKDYINFSCKQQNKENLFFTYEVEIRFKQSLMGNSN